MPPGTRLLALSPPLLDARALSYRYVARGLDDELGTRRLYERIATAGVDVHLYGLPGRAPNAETYTVHAGEDAEFADIWFVVYDGDDDPSQAGALVTEETEPGHYSGFWTYSPGVTRATLDYLDSTC